MKVDNFKSEFEFLVTPNQISGLPEPPIFEIFGSGYRQIPAPAPTPTPTPTHSHAQLPIVMPIVIPLVIVIVIFRVPYK